MQQVAAEVSTATSSRPVKPGVQSTAPGFGFMFLSCGTLPRLSTASSSSCSRLQRRGIRGDVWRSRSPARRSKKERRSRSNTPATARTSRRRSPGAELHRAAPRLLSSSTIRTRRPERGCIGCCTTFQQRRRSYPRTSPRPTRRRALVVGALACGALLGRREKGEVPAVPYGRFGSHRTVHLPSPFSPSFTVLLPSPSSPPFVVVVLPARIRAMMSAVWIQNNRHWDELAGVNTLTQLLGTAKPTQREYLGCLAGDVAHDTLWVRERAALTSASKTPVSIRWLCRTCTQRR